MILSVIYWKGEHMRFDDFVWTREPEKYVVDGDSLRVTTSPHTDLWQFFVTAVDFHDI